VGGSRFFDPLFAAFDHMMDEGFVNGSTRQILQRSDSADDAVQRALAAAPTVVGKLRTLDVTSKRSLR
jgi:predicted Rossmann-fold nucleotide-binding protein